MDTSELLSDSFNRIRELYTEVAADLSPEDAHQRPDGNGNPIAWLLWHTARVQDDHVAGLAGTPQAWGDGWAAKFGLPFAEGDIGFGHSSDEVDTLHIERLEDLVGYHHAVHRLSLEYAEGIDAGALDRVVDERWDPPVTAGVRLVSLLGDCLQHLGQAAYVKGLR